MAGNLAPIDALIHRAVEEAGRERRSPIFCYSLKDDPDQEGGVPRRLRRLPAGFRQGKSRVDVLISTLSFTVANLSDGTHTEATGAVVDLLDRLDVPVLQAVLCTSTSAEWDAILTPA